MNTTLNDHALLAAANATAQLQTATVTGRAGDWLFLRGHAAVERARVAPSCLLVPEIGDVVLLCLSTDEAGVAVPSDDQKVAQMPCRHHVLAVLARAQAGQGTVALPGGVRLQAQDGALQMAARRIELSAPERVQARTSHFELEALQADLRVGELRSASTRVTVVTQELHLVARNVRQHLGRLVQKLRDSFRTVDGVDDVRAGRARWEIEGHAQMHARQATVLADGAVKIDGARIDLG